MGVGILDHHEWSTLGLAGWLHIVALEKKGETQSRGAMYGVDI